MSQAHLGKYQPAVSTETVTRTVVCKLETSQRKNDRLRPAIEEWQTIASRMGDLMPSFPAYRWGTTQDTHLYRVLKREFPDRDVYAATAHEAAKKVTEAFESWRENGQRGDRPSFGDGSYARFRSDHISVEENDRGWGLCVKLYPREDPEWWHINAGEYQREYLTAITQEEASTGSAELHLTDGGELYAHLTVSYPVEVYDSGDVSTWVGVDLGERVLYAAAAVDGSAGVQEVAVESGREFRHHREKLDRKRGQAMRDGAIAKIKAERERYTDQVTNTATRAIVDMAVAHEPCGIRIEDLTGYREHAAEPIHDWPHHMLREQIAYKATEAGVPVEVVDPRNTSITCRKCGSVNPAARDGVEFSCPGCGYEVHADVNAAMNIAQTV